MIKTTDYKNLEKLIQKHEIQTYHSKGIAQRYALKRNWNKKDILGIQRDLDFQWIIAKQKDGYIEVMLWHDIGKLKLEKAGE